MLCALDSLFLSGLSAPFHYLSHTLSLSLSLSSCHKDSSGSCQVYTVGLSSSRGSHHIAYSCTHTQTLSFSLTNWYAWFLSLLCASARDSHILNTPNGSILNINSLAVFFSFIQTIQLSQYSNVMGPISCQQLNIYMSAIMVYNQFFIVCMGAFGSRLLLIYNCRNIVLPISTFLFYCVIIILLCKLCKKMSDGRWYNKKKHVERVDMTEFLIKLLFNKLSRPILSLLIVLIVGPYLMFMCQIYKDRLNTSVRNSIV